MVQRQPTDAYGELRHGYFGQELEVICQEKTDPDLLKFESLRADYPDYRYNWTSSHVKNVAIDMLFSARWEVHIRVPPGCEELNSS